jgi:hypothetical protein
MMMDRMSADDSHCPHCGRWIPPDMLADPLDYSGCINRNTCPPKPQPPAWPEREDKEEVEA